MGDSTDGLYNKLNIKVTKIVDEDDIMLKLLNG
jgi:hypothetical protein